MTFPKAPSFREGGTLGRALLAGLVLLVAAGCSAPDVPAGTAVAPAAPTAAPTRTPQPPRPALAGRSATSPVVTRAQEPPAAPPAAGAPAGGVPAASPTAVPATAAPAAGSTAQQADPPSPSTRAPSFDVQVVAAGLDTPWALAFAPDGRIFVTERPGRIRIIKDGQLQAEPWMTLSAAETSEGGLLGLALDPQFAQNHYVYAAYTYQAGGGTRNRLVRLREDPATGRGAMDKVLLDGVLGNYDHDGGRVKFGPDGKLYWTTGDALNSNLAQDPTSLNGKILRLNPDGSIPQDNPFPNSPVYSYGHRNSEGLAWQPGTGRLYATEHGPSGVPSCCRDEINLIEPGQNYGWPLITGDQTRNGLRSPVLTSGSSVTWAPAGAAFVTRGPWAGSLFFGGLRGQSLYWLTLDPNDPRKVTHFEPLLGGQYGRLRDVVEGPDGALYVTTSNRDGRGNPGKDDDRVLRLTLK